MSLKRKASRRKIKKSPFLGLFCLGVLICISMAATIYLIFLRPGTHPQAEKKPTTAAPKISQEIVLPAHIRQEAQPPPAAEKIVAMVQPEGPKLAIIIDDIGSQRKLGEKFIDLDLNLNFSILPHTAHGLELAQKAHSKGRDILLHLPMEPIGQEWDPGPGALFLKMDANTRRKTLLDDINFVPMAVGINNHMGSRYTENEGAMAAFLAEIKPKNLFFIDSLTSSKSVGYTLAQKMAVKTAQRNLFLDNEKDPAIITKQIERLIKIAQKHGKAIGIGHPYPSTLEALSKSLPLLQKEVIVTSIHNLVE